MERGALQSSPSPNSDSVIFDQKKAVETGPRERETRFILTREGVMAKKDKLLKGMRQKSAKCVEYRFTYKKKRYEVTGKDAAECLLKAEEKKQDIENKKFKTADKLTVSEYIERWTAAKVGTVKETTIRTDTILLNRINETIIDEAGTKFGELLFTKVEAQNVRDLQRALQAELKTKDKNGKEVTRKGMTTRATNDAIYLLKQVYKTAIQERVTEWNPVIVKPLKRTEAPARDTIHRALTKAETAAFMEAAKVSAYYPLYQFLLNTGCRLGEAGALMIGDVTPQGVKVCRTITRTEVGGYMIGDETKTAAGRRTIPVNESAMKAWSRQREIREAIDGAPKIGTPVFTAPRGGLLKSANVNYDIAKYCDAAKIERFSVHAFRDTFATRCVESGMQVKMLQEIMGHTDISMTLGLYAHAMEDQKQEQLKAVNFM